MHIFNNIKKVLVLAPHTDDGELGVGGTIHYLIGRSVEVYYAAFSTAEDSVSNDYPKNILEIEVKKATSKLGIKSEHLIIYHYKVRKLSYVRQEILEELIKLRDKLQFDMVFIPSLNDIHQDHRTIAQEGLRAFKNVTLLGYELIWNNLSFNTQCFVKLSLDDINAKINALTAYKSQSGRNYMSPEFIKSLAIVRGVQIGCEYAESFEVIRLII